MRFDPRRAINGFKRSIDSPLLLPFAHHTGAIDQSAKVHENVRAPPGDFPPPSIRYAAGRIGSWKSEKSATDHTVNIQIYTKKNEWIFFTKTEIDHRHDQPSADMMVILSCDFLSFLLTTIMYWVNFGILVES